MTKIKWFFMSKYKRLLHNIECAYQNKQRLHLGNGIILDFTTSDREKCEELASYKPVEGKFYYGQQLYIKNGN